MHCVINGIVVIMLGPENDEVGRVISWALMIRDARGNMKGLPVYTRVSSDDSQYKRVVNHDDMNVVRVLGDSINVGDGEWDKVESIISYESRWDV